MPAPQKPDLRDLPALAKRLLSEGPVKTYPAHRRVRALVGSTYVLDSLNAVYIWEHPAYPWFYVPFNDLHKDVKIETIETVTPTAAASANGSSNASARVLRLTTPDGTSTDRAIHFGEAAGHGLSDHVRLEFAAAGAWYEEDTRIFGHPKDPFKRIDTLNSLRRVKISLNSEVLAEASWSVHLHETGLPVRYYMPRTCVRERVLEDSAEGTESTCPYKGIARYYDVLVGGERFKDLVWWYQSPNLECAEIKGLVCFYNEKVDVEVDGVKLERPVSYFS